MKDNQSAMFELVLNKLDELKEENKELRSQLQAQPIPQTVNQTVNNIVNNNLYVNVTICSFGKEDLTKIDTNGVVKLLEGQVKDFMPRMIEYIHANPNHPENHNVFYDPERQKAIVFAPTMDGNQLTWQAREIGQVSKAITDKIKEHMRPGAGPYFDKLSRTNTEAANKVIQISHMDWNTPEVLEGSKAALSKVTKNEGFMEQVKVLE
jgi:hypothetical protein